MDESGNRTQPGRRTPLIIGRQTGTVG